MKFLNIGSQFYSVGLDEKLEKHISIIFFKLFESIGDQLKVCNCEKSPLLLIFQQIIASVVDYSNAQQLGFQDIYEQFMTTIEVGIQCQFSQWNQEGHRFFFIY